jgi:hypothetical protein
MKGGEQEASTYSLRKIERERERNKDNNMMKEGEKIGKRRIRSLTPFARIGRGVDEKSIVLSSAFSFAREFIYTFFFNFTPHHHRHPV